MRREHIVGGLMLVALTGLTGVAMWKTHRPGAAPAGNGAPPPAIMGTRSHLIAVMAPGHENRAQAAQEAARNALRAVEAMMSWRLEDSEVGRLNAAPAGQTVKLSDHVMEVLALSRRVCEDSDGAFDVTCLPIIELWRIAQQEGRPPSMEQREQARAESSWPDLEVLDGAARKHKDSVRVDLGGIAKGYGIDRAVEAMQQAGATGGLVDVGGDIRCFGRRADGQTWRVGVRDPFGKGMLGVLELTDAAVCTSGNYERFYTIGGRRLSHIIDPRPVGRYGALPEGNTPPSVTVVAPAAALADAWATALSVLGPEGMSRLPEGVEALVVTGGPDDRRLHATAGFGRLLVEKPDDWPAALSAPEVAR